MGMAAIRALTSSGTAKARFLICAPSNAACDEICARLLDLPDEVAAVLPVTAGVEFDPAFLAVGSATSVLLGTGGGFGQTAAGHRRSAGVDGRNAELHLGTRQH